MIASAVIEHLQLEPHTEGGFFRRTYTAQQLHHDRPLLSSIYYLLSWDQPVGHLHCNRSDILHFWQGGGALRYTLVHAGGRLEEVILGPDIDAGQQLQLVVTGGTWKASELLDTGGEVYDYGLISEAVCPGFDYADQQLATPAYIEQHFPQHEPQLRRLIKA